MSNSSWLANYPYIISGTREDSQVVIGRFLKRLIGIVEDVDIRGNTRTAQLMIKRQTAGDIGFFAVHPRSCQPAKQFGLECGYSHCRILPTRL